MTPRRALVCLIVVTTAIRLVWAALLGVGNDEAYHYLFAVHPALSYYDHPPMLAIVEAAGLSLAGGAATPLALRVGFVILFAGSTLLMARLAGRFYGAWAGFFAALILNLSAYHSAAVGAFALPDGPLLFFWLLTLDRLAAALAAPERLRPWLGVGLAWGGALLSKYHAVLLPAGMVLYLLLDREARPVLRHGGPYLAAAVGGLVFSPVLAWNATHGWASFAFQGGRAVGASQFRPDTLLGAIGGPAVYLSPWIWAFLVVTMFRRLRAWVAGTAEAADRFLLCMAIVPVGGFLAVACFRPILPHWPLVGYVSLMPMLGRSWALRSEAQPARMRRRVAVLSAFVLAAVCLVLVWHRTGLLLAATRGTLGLTTTRSDPTAEMYGWPEVARELRRRGLVGQPGTFLFTSKWYHSGQLAFALGNSVPVLCYNPNDSHGFAQWSRPEDWVGRDGLLLVINRSSTEPQFYDRWFERIEPLAEFSIDRAGVTIRRVRVYRCVRQTRPFPFDGSSRADDPTRVALDDDEAGRGFRR